MKITLGFVLRCVLLILISHAAVYAQTTYSKFAPANGVLKGSTSTYVTTPAANTDIVGLFSGSCSATTYLSGSGVCSTPAGTGGGTVNSVAQTVPAGFTVTGSPITGSGTLAITYTTGQTANEFLATPDGTTGSLALRKIVAGDLPSISLTSMVTGILPVPNGGIGVGTLTGVAKGNGTSAFTAAASSDVIGLWTGTCSSTTFLRGDGACAAPSTVGTVTSVAQTVPSGFTITGSPITTSGTLAIGGVLNPVAGGSGEAGTITGVLKGNATSAYTAALAADVYGLWSGTCSASTFLRGDGACMAPAGATGANPSASVGLTAVNGTATTFLRSDGAPAIDQSITPTWTGLHLFNGGIRAGNQTGELFRMTTTTARGGGNDYLDFFDPTGVKGYLGYVINTDDYYINNALAGAVNVQTQNATRIAIGSAGNVTIAAPSSGTALGVSGVSGSDTAVFDSVHTGTNVGINTGANIYVGSSTNLNIGTTTGATGVLNLSTGATIRETISSAGAVTINAPSAGATLTMTAASASTTAEVINGASAGESLIEFNANAGSNIGFVGVAGAGGQIVGDSTTGDAVIRSGTGVRISSNGGSSTALAVNSAGDVTIAGPTSGVALSVTGVASGNTEVIQASGSASHSFGLVVAAGSNSSDYNTLFESAAGASIGLIYGDGGFAVGTPTGGDKGSGSLNAQSMFVNNAPVLTTASGGANKFASGLLTTSGGNTCSITDNGGGLVSCAESAVGRPVLTFTTGYFPTNFVCTATALGPNLSELVNTNGLSATTLQIYVTGSASGANIDGSFSIICIGQ